VRTYPKRLLNDAKSIITWVSLTRPRKILDRIGAPRARRHFVLRAGADYHDVLKKRLKRLASWNLRDHGGDVKIFVYTAP